MGTINDSQLTVPDYTGGHRKRQVPSIFNFISTSAAAGDEATSAGDTLQSWNNTYSGITSLDAKLAKHTLREWQGIKIEDVNLGDLSIDNLKQMMPSELDKLMQEDYARHDKPHSVHATADHCMQSPHGQ